MPERIRAKLGGHWWVIEVTNRLTDSLHGLADDKERIIKIRRSLNGRLLLEVAIHEMLHAECPYLEEETVDTAAANIAAALWKTGVVDVKSD